VIYCDGIHLVGTDESELHQFAESVGMKRGWFQNHPTHPHYCILSRQIRKAAFAAGAQSVTSREIVQLMLSGKLCKGPAMLLDKRIESVARECGLEDAWSAIKRHMGDRRSTCKTSVKYYVVGKDRVTGKFVPFKPVNKTKQ